MFNVPMSRISLDPRHEPFIDEATLSDIFDELGAEHSRQMMLMVERDARKRLLSLGDCVARRDSRAIHAHAHALAGLLGHFGFARAAACARALEKNQDEAAGWLELLQWASDQAFQIVSGRIETSPRRAA